MNDKNKNSKKLINFTASNKINSNLFQDIAQLIKAARSLFKMVRFTKFFPEKISGYTVTTIILILFYRSYC